MKWIITIAALLLLAVQQSRAQNQKEVLSHIPSTGKDMGAFVPSGYDTMATAIGDLNGDGKPDMVLVLHDKREDSAVSGSDIVENNRPLIVLLKTNDGWKVAAKSVNVVLCKDCGGVYGDPFMQVYIRNGVILVDHYGGSNWRWGYTHKFRYRDGDFYLIGLTKDSYCVFGGTACGDIGSASRDFEDINFVTGQRERQKTSENCKVLMDKKDKIAIKPLVKLADYILDN